MWCGRRRRQHPSDWKNSHVYNVIFGMTLTCCDLQIYERLCYSFMTVDNISGNKIYRTLLFYLWTNKIQSNHLEKRSLSHKILITQRRQCAIKYLIDKRLSFFLNWSPMTKQFCSRRILLSLWRQTSLNFKESYNL